MKRTPVLAVLAPVLLMLAPVAMTADLTRADVDKMLAECNDMREEKLAPIRKEKTDNCIASKEMEPERCRDYYRTYGAVRHVGGMPRPGMFSDLPVCQRAYQAERTYKHGIQVDTDR